MRAAALALAALCLTGCVSEQASLIAAATTSFDDGTWRRMAGRGGSPTAIRYACSTRTCGFNAVVSVDARRPTSGLCGTFRRYGPGTTPYSGALGGGADAKGTMTLSRPPKRFANVLGTDATLVSIASNDGNRTFFNAHVGCSGGYEFLAAVMTDQPKRGATLADQALRAAVALPR